MSRAKEDVTFDAKRALASLGPLIRQIEHDELIDMHGESNLRPKAFREFWGYRRAIMIALEREVKRSETLAKRIAKHNKTGKK